MFRRTTRNIRYRRINPRNVWISVLLLSSVYVLFTFEHQHVHREVGRNRHDRMCSDVESLAFITEVCNLHEKGVFVGPLCSHLCGRRNLQYQGCAGHKHGKTVLLMTCENICKKNESITVAMKSIDLKRRQGIEPMLYPIDPLEDQRDYFIKIKTITQDLIYKSLIDNQAVVVNDSDILSLLWGVNFTEFVSQHQDIANISLVALDSVFSLENMYEYTFMKLHSEKTFIPKIYGTCGPAYFEENTASIDRLITKAKGIAPWSVRAKVAVKMIELMKRLDTLFESPVHICDLKSSNFGLRQMSQVTIIDFDCVMLDSLLKQVFKVQRCESNADCRMCDCFSECDAETGYCTELIYNSNIQRLCQNVFMEFQPSLRRGLLMNPPGRFKSDLINLLTKCAYPEGMTFEKRVRASTSYHVVDLLQTLLQDSIKYT